MKRQLIVAVCLLGAACGGGGDDTPTTPAPTPQQNRAPIISSTTVTPTFGVADLQSFAFNAIASDPDGDALTFSWNAAGNTGSGPTPPPIIFLSPGGSGSATVTVTDGKGGTASSSVNFTVGSMSGTWRVTTGLPNMTLQLNQSNSGLITGSWSQPPLGGGVTDPVQPGRIDIGGQVTMRLKVTTGSFTDFNMTGSMDTTGRRVTGNLQGSGFTGQPFVMEKQ